MNVLVTGGAGYIGSTLVPLLLKSGQSVRVLDNLSFGGRSLLGVWPMENFELVRGDIRESEVLDRALDGIEAVVHLAAIVGDPACARDPILAKAVNLNASLALIDASRKAGVKRFIFGSTCSNYGKMKDTSVLASEASALAPVSLYAEAKVAVELSLLKSAGGPGWSPTCLRFATVYGVSPRMRFDLTVNEFTMEMVANKKLVVFGEQFWRPYVHVSDVARAISLVLTSPEKKVAGVVFNVGDTDQNFQKETLVNLIRPFAPDARVEFVHKNEDPRDYRVSFAAIRDQLGYRATRTVPDGIAEVAALVRDRVLDNFTSNEYRN